MKYSSSIMNEVFLIGHFNSMTHNRQHGTYDLEEPVMMQSISLKDLGTCRSSANSRLDNTKYGKHLLALGVDDT